MLKVVDWKHGNVVKRCYVVERVVKAETPELRMAQRIEQRWRLLIEVLIAAIAFDRRTLIEDTTVPWTYLEDVQRIYVMFWCVVRWSTRRWYI